MSTPAKRSATPIDHLKVIANEDAMEKWFEENDTEGVVFEYPVIGASPEGAGKPDDDFFESPGVDGVGAKVGHCNKYQWK